MIYLDQLPRDKCIIVVCYSGQTAGQIVGSLALAGFNAFTLSGGAGSFTAETPLETTANAFVPAANRALTENESLLMDAIRYSMTMPEGKNMLQVTDLAKDTSKYFILDVRTQELYNKGHIKGATLIPYLELGANLDKLPKDETIAVICNSGQQSSQTVAVLKAAGFTVLNVQSGMNNGWYKNDLPVDTETVEEPEAPAASGTYTVVAGDSLWKIAKSTLGSGLRWNEIYEANNAAVKDPNKISIGQVLVIPA